ncbi:hypothetical protein Drorol1_Dr00013149 [Drosera rotundifolia]
MNFVHKGLLAVVPPCPHLLVVVGHRKSCRNVAGKAPMRCFKLVHVQTSIPKTPEPQLPVAGECHQRCWGSSERCLLLFSRRNFKERHEGAAWLLLVVLGEFLGVVGDSGNRSPMAAMARLVAMMSGDDFGSASSKKKTTRGRGDDGDGDDVVARWCCRWRGGYGCLMMGWRPWRSPACFTDTCWVCENRRGLKPVVLVARWVVVGLTCTSRGCGGCVRGVRKLSSEKVRVLCYVIWIWCGKDEFGVVRGVGLVELIPQVVSTIVGGCDALLLRGYNLDSLVA